MVTIGAQAGLRRPQEAADSAPELTPQQLVEVEAAIAVCVHPIEGTRQGAEVSEIAGPDSPSRARSVRFAA